MDEKEIVNRECRFVIHVPVKEKKDLHLIKENIQYSDGTSKPNVRLLHNYKRPFYVTKKSLRNHLDKKEAEDLKNLDEFKTTQTDLTMNICKALNIYKQNSSLRSISESPYLYGADIASTALIKKEYAKVTKTQTPYSVAIFDVETDVLHGNGEIILATISFKDKVYTAIKKSFVNSKIDVEKQVFEKSMIYLKEYIDSRSIKLELGIFDNEIDLVKNVIKKAHEWKPDFLAVWNIEFDMGKILDVCKKVDLDPKEIMCDPIIPNEFKYFKFSKGQSKKIKANGEVNPIIPADRWHSVFCPSSFYWIDAMCVYKRVRTAEQQEPSYSLDNILSKNLNITKLKFNEIKDLKGLEWHSVMQKDYQIEYILYNIFDCISVELLDEKTKDMSIKVPMLSGYSDFKDFKSQPRKLVDSLHFFYLENYNKIIATTSGDMEEESDEFVNLEDWVVTLPTHLLTEQGLRIIEESKNIVTNIYTHVYDSDVASGYPNGGIVFNISKETTVKELISIEGVSEHDKKMGTINFSAGQVNSLEICNKLLGMPTLENWEVLFKNTLEV